MESLEWNSSWRFFNIGDDFKMRMIVMDNDDNNDANVDDLSQGFPVLLHPVGSPSSSQLLIPADTFRLHSIPVLIAVEYIWFLSNHICYNM